MFQSKVAESDDGRYKLPASDFFGGGVQNQYSSVWEDSTIQYNHTYSFVTSDLVSYLLELSCDGCKG